MDVVASEVFSSHFDISFRWASCDKHCAALILHGDAVELFLFVVRASDEDGVGVFDSVLKDGLANVDDVIAAVAGSVGIEGGREDVGVFTGLCEEELLDVVDECVAVLAEGDGTERGRV